MYGDDQSNKKLHIKERIKNLRLKLNMSQDRFGKKIGLSGKTVSAYETGKCTPPLKVLEKVSRIYGASFVTMGKNNHIELKSKLESIKLAVMELEERLL